jgi:hypothetical protein
MCANVTWGGISPRTPDRQVWIFLDAPLPLAPAGINARSLALVLPQDISVAVLAQIARLSQDGRHCRRRQLGNRQQPIRFRRVEAGSIPLVVRICLIVFRPISWPRLRRFSSCRCLIASCWWRLTQPATIRIKDCNGKTLMAGKLHHLRVSARRTGAVWLPTTGRIHAGCDRPTFGTLRDRGRDGLEQTDGDVGIVTPAVRTSRCIVHVGILIGFLERGRRCRFVPYGDDEEQPGNSAISQGTAD